MADTPKSAGALNSPTPFNFGRHAVRVVVRKGAPWFVATDVCCALGYVNPRKAVADHLDADEKGVTTGDTLGGAQTLTIISESGLYALVLRSRKPEARRFAKWVTGEVLPAIRKTGSYAPAPAAPLAEGTRVLMQVGPDGRMVSSEVLAPGTLVCSWERLLQALRCSPDVVPVELRHELAEAMVRSAMSAVTQPVAGEGQRIEAAIEDADESLSTTELIAISKRAAVMAWDRSIRSRDGARRSAAEALSDGPSNRLRATRKQTSVAASVAFKGAKA
jgi:prophage antirepressor-like protein